MDKRYKPKLFLANWRHLKSSFMAIRSALWTRVLERHYVHRKHFWKNIHTKLNNYFIVCFYLSFILLFINHYLFYFMYSSVHGYWGCSHCLAVLNHAVMNIHVQVFMWTCKFSFLLVMSLGVELLDYMVILCLTFWGFWIIFLEPVLL